MPAAGVCECNVGECKCQRRSWAAHVPWLRLAGIAAAVVTVIAFPYAPTESREYVNGIPTISTCIRLSRGRRQRFLGWLRDGETAAADSRRIEVKDAFVSQQSERRCRPPRRCGASETF